MIHDDPYKNSSKQNMCMANTTVRTRRSRYKGSRHTVRATKTNIGNLKAEIIEYFSDGYLSWSAKKKKYQILGTNVPKDGIIECPECRIGMLVVIRSPKTKKRFIGCSNYHNGCEASSPLLQRAKLRVTKSPCSVCSWPMVIFRYSRNQSWTRRCSNIRCQASAKVAV